MMIATPEAFLVCARSLNDDGILSDKHLLMVEKNYAKLRQASSHKAIIAENKSLLSKVRVEIQKSKSLSISAYLGLDDVTPL